MSSALLLTEPEEATRSFLERHLRQDGFDVVEAENGEALDLFEESRPDLVLIGDPEGLELCRRLREGEPGRLGRETCDPARPHESDPVDRVRAFDRGLRRLPRPALPLRRAGRADPRGAEARRAAGVGTHEAGEIEIDRPTRRVTVAGRRVVLPTKEYELLLSSRATRTASSRRRSSSATSGASAPRPARVRSTRTRRACAGAWPRAVRPERLGRRLLPARRVSACAEIDPP